MNDQLKLLAFSVVVFVCAYSASCFFTLPLYLLIVLTVFFSAFTLLLNSRLKKAMQSENKNQFTNTYLGLTGLKMLSSCILLAVILSISKENSLYFGLSIMAYYMLYTVFEVVFWKRKLKG